MVLAAEDGLNMPSSLPAIARIQVTWLFGVGTYCFAELAAFEIMAFGANMISRASRSSPAAVRLAAFNLTRKIMQARVCPQIGGFRSISLRS